MRYLKNVVTGESIAVSDDDDARFEELKAARQENGRPLYVQTGAHDPAVSQVEVNGQDPANGEEPITPGATTIPGREAPTASTTVTAPAGADDGELADLTRDQLDERARKAGVDEPEKLPNKDAVIDAIRGARA